jgi:ubiquinone/menaquinone biosynthesis C-methylase UbiE
MLVSHVEYLDAAARSRAGRSYKRRLLEELRLEPGMVIADVGCGPGADIGSMAELVAPGGRVIGLDSNPEMVDVAQRRYAMNSIVDVRPGDAHQLELETASVDRARTDRILQHVDDPQAVVCELARIVRPGGLVGMAEPDWDTLVIDDEQIETSRAFSRFLAGRVRNPDIGRRLPRLANQAGLTARQIIVNPVVFDDFGSAEQLLGLRRNTERAVEEGSLPEADAAKWLARLESGAFFATFALVMVVAQVGSGNDVG